MQKANPNSILCLLNAKTIILKGCVRRMMLPKAHHEANTPLNLKCVTSPQSARET